MPSVATTVAGGRGFLAPYRGEKEQEFQGIMVLRSGRTLARRARSEDISPLLQAAQDALGTTLAPEAVVKRVAAQHPDTLWTFIRNERRVGCLAMLMLNEIGLEALLSERINFRDPALRFLADPTEVPAAIYIWAVLAPALAVDGIAEVMARLRCPQYDSTNIYASQATEHGGRLLRRLHFDPIHGQPRNLYKYTRAANRRH